MPDYFILVADEDERFCVIDTLPSDMPDSYHAVDGLPMTATGYDYEFDMAADEPGLIVPDYINNLLGYTLVSSRFKDLLTHESSAEIQYVPFRLKNHKGRYVDQELFIANVIGTHDCVNRDETEADEDFVNVGRFSYIDHLVFDESLIDKSLDVFRLTVRPRHLALREDLADTLRQSDMTGFQLLRVGDDFELS